MPEKPIRAGLMPLAVAAVLFLLIAAVLLIMRGGDEPIPADAVYVTRARVQAEVRA